jgi:transposase
MMGFKERAFAPLVAVSLEELVPQDHFYRHLQKVLDLSFVSDLVRESYAVAGRPSIDPVVFFKLQLVMFFEDIRSERLLLRQVADRLSVRWYVGYDLDQPLPDHSTLSKTRQRYGLSVFQRFFEAIVELCQQAKLIWGKELYFDSTQVNANADLDSLVPRFAVEAREAIKVHLAALFPSEAAEPQTPEERICDDPQLAETSSAKPTALPTSISEEQREELALDNAARHDWIAQGGRQQREVSGAYQRTADFRISTTDPDATPMRLKTGGTHLGYHTHYVVDGGKRRIILAALVVPGEVMDNQPMLDLLWHVSFRWRVRPQHVTGDTKYGTLENIKAIEDAHIRAFVPLPDWEHKTSYYGPAQFSYDAVHDQYRCPQGQVLFPFPREEQAQLVEYRTEAGTCNACPVKMHCTPSKRGRHLHRSFFAAYQDRVKSYHQTLAYQKAMNKRKVWVEPLFAEGKQWHGMRRFRLRRLWRVNGEALVIASGQNLKRLLQKRGWGRRPFPTEAMAMMPPLKEKPNSPSKDLRLSRSDVAVASLVASWAFRSFFESQISLFSLMMFVLSHNTSLHYLPKKLSATLHYLFSFLSRSQRIRDPSSSSASHKLNRKFFNRLGRFLRQRSDRLLSRYPEARFLLCWPEPQVPGNGK